ncbi:MAG: hypothetical protein JXB23_01695 [Candidatus Aminicenantes bacterium]|nr:hypothetical protein [Candidatus Aminicenantes bacterium]
MLPIPADELDKILIRTDKLRVHPSGHLMIEDCAVVELLERFGSPLYVVAEATLRENYRRLKRAFSGLWPNPGNVLYAIKANNNLAVRAIMNREGAGGDCFGLGELHATLAGGADPSKVVLNGSNKSLELIRKAVEMGITVNIDAEDEIRMIEETAAELKTKARAKMRLKVYSDEYNSIATESFPNSGWSRGAISSETESFC